MADISTKLSEITKNEEREREKQKKLLDISQTITTFRRKIHENEIKATVLEKERFNLLQECMKLKIQSELQQIHLDSVRANVNQQLKLLQEEKVKLNEIQENMWEKMKEFINTVDNGYQNAERNMVAIKDFIKMCTDSNENQKVKNENIKLEGEIYGLYLFRKFQEKQINQVKKHLVHFEKISKD